MTATAEQPTASPLLFWRQRKTEEGVALALLAKGPIRLDPVSTKQPDAP